MSEKYVYILLMRPPGPGCQPMNGLISVSNRMVMRDGRMGWGTARYNRKLTEEEEKHYDMECLGTMEDEM